MTSSAGEIYYRVDDPFYVYQLFHGSTLFTN